MRKNFSVAVTSRTFCMHPNLREELQAHFENIKYLEESVKLEGDSLIGFLKDSDLAIIALNKINSSVLQNLPRLKGISKYGVGIDNIDMGAIDQFGLKFGWTGGVNRRAVSELTLCFVLTLLRKTFWHHLDVRGGKWVPATDRELSNQTIGIVGCGNIGKDVIRLIKGFGSKIVFNDLIPMKDFSDETGAIQCDLDSLLASCDIVSLHLPYNDKNHGIFSNLKIAKMKKGAILINTCRGNIVDEEALYIALRENHLRAAAFDVFSMEPPLGNPLLSLENFIATPHIGGSTDVGVLSMGRAAISNLVQIANELEKSSS